MTKQNSMLNINIQNKRWENFDKHCLLLMQFFNVLIWEITPEMKILQYRGRLIIINRKRQYT